MKRIFSTALLLISISVYSQTPSVINYQGVARNAAGNPIVGVIGVSVTIHVGTPNGTPTLVEQYSPTTNQFGVFDIRIGSNTAGGLSNIGWGTNKFFLGVSIDPTGGSNFGPEISNQQFVSVPYALYAEKSGGTSPGGSLTASPNVTVTSSGTNTFNINVPNYIAGNNVTITPLNGNNYQINAGNSATSNPTSPWSSTTGAVFLSNIGDNVGIGTNFPGAKVGVVSSNSIGVFVNSGGNNGIQASTSSSNSGHSALYGSNGGGPSAGTGVTGITNSSVSAGVRGQNLNNGPGVFGVNTNGSTSSLAHGVYGETNSSGVNAAGVQGSNFGSGPGVYGWQNSISGSAAVVGIANSAVSAGVYGLNNNGFAGVMGEIVSGPSSIAAHGVTGRTNGTSTLAAGVLGKNNGNGHGVYGETSSGNNLVGGVSGFNNGTGPALKGALPSATVAGGSNLSLLIENGHIKSKQSSGITVSTYTFSGGVTGVTYTSTGCTDVKGNLMAVVTTTGMINVGGQVGIRIDFNKPYTVLPTVVISPASDFKGVSYHVSLVGQNFFEVLLKNNTSVNVLGSSIPFNFNYLIME